MKVEVKENNIKKERSFPKLMVSLREYNKGMVVFFESYKFGQVLNDCACYKSGYYSDSWDMECFTDFEGSITLSND